MKTCIYTGALIAAASSGLITVANASQASYGSLSTELTGYQAGLPAPDLEALLDKLFPPVPGGRLFQYRKAKDEAIVTETDDSDIRAEGADFKKVEYRGEVASAALINKGLTYVQDHDKLARTGAGTIIPGWENRIATMLRLRLIRADILRGIAALRTAAGSATGKTWSASTNPDGDLRAMVAASLAATGLLPTDLLIGYSGWQLRQDAYEAATRANHAMANHADYDEAKLAAYLGIRNVTRSEHMYQAKKAGAKTAIIGNEVLVYNAEPGLTLDDASSIKRVTGDTDAGTRWGVYVEPTAKATKITVEQYSTFIVPWTAGVINYTASA